MTGQAIANALDRLLGTGWRELSGSQIVALIDTALGSTDWRAGGGSWDVGFDAGTSSTSYTHGIDGGSSLPHVGTPTTLDGNWA